MAVPEKSGCVDLTTLESHLWEAANSLRGPVDASDFKTKIVRGGTLRDPAFFTGDSLSTFDGVIANGPFSVERWCEDLWVNGRYGRNFAGVPPRSSADYAFVQHMLKSMAPGTGRMAVVLPHGVLCGMGVEGKIRRAILEMDKVEAIIGLGRLLIINASSVFKKGRNQNTLHTQSLLKDSR